MTIKTYVIPDLQGLARSMAEEMNELADWQLDEMCRNKESNGIEADTREAKISKLIYFRAYEMMNDKQRHTWISMGYGDLLYEFEIPDRRTIHPLAENEACVVRCKDCIYYANTIYHRCDLYGTVVQCSPEWFCGSAVRKEVEVA